MTPNFWLRPIDWVVAYDSYITDLMIQAWIFLDSFQEGLINKELKKKVNHHNKNSRPVSFQKMRLEHTL